MRRSDIERHIQKIERKKAVQWLLPDICHIYPAEGEELEVSGPGIATYKAPEPRLYRDMSGLDTPDVPCRITIERAFVPDKLYGQATVVSRYVLEVPVSMRGKVLATDRVVMNDRKYEIRKISDQSAWDVTLELTIIEISTDIDHE